MKKVAVLAVGLALGVTLTGWADDKPAKSDDKKAGKLDAGKLVGTYTFVSGTKDGEKLPADRFKGTSLVVTKETMTLKTPDGDFKIGYKLDASATPAAVDMEILDGPVGKGSTSKGIISLDGDTLKLAYHPTGGDRPKDFDAKQGSGVQTFTMKKSEEKKKEK